MDSPSDKISVVIPTFNRAHLIAETLESVKAQSFKPAEIIVVDDGSEDDTENVVKKFGNVKYHKIPNSGVCIARNYGVEKSRSEWIAFCDSDDLWEKNKLLHQMELATSAPECEYCFTNFRIVKGDTWSHESKFDQMPFDYFDVEQIRISAEAFVITQPLYEKLLIFNPIFPSTVMLSKSFFRRIGKFNTSFSRRISEDFEFTLRCAQECPIGVNTKPLVGIRKHLNNFSKGELSGISFVIGDIDILKFSAKNHKLGHRFECLITEEIIKRSTIAAHSAFALGEARIFKTMMKNIPICRRPFKLWVKWVLVPVICFGLRHRLATVRRYAINR